MACVATWSFGLEAVVAASEDIKLGRDCIDVLERAINVVEDNPDTGIYYVGRGCYPNRDGVVQLDAAMMRGRDCSFGAVAALERYARPISVARRVLEHPSLSMLVGTGATQFAAEERFHLEDNNNLLTQQTRQAYHDFKAKNAYPVNTGHDTLSVLCLDMHGHVGAGVSTSGPPFKPPGRVGDSPLPGCGLYADDNAGAAAATGDGERIMQFCPSFHIVQLIKSGRSPQEACSDVVRKMRTESEEYFEVGVIALSNKGEVGGAGTVKEWRDSRTNELYGGFPYAQWTKDIDISSIITEPGLQ